MTAHPDSCTRAQCAGAGIQKRDVHRMKKAIDTVAGAAAEDVHLASITTGACVGDVGKYVGAYFLTRRENLRACETVAVNESGWC